MELLCIGSDSTKVSFQSICTFPSLRNHSQLIICVYIVDLKPLCNNCFHWPMHQASDRARQSSALFIACEMRSPNLIASSFSENSTREFFTTIFLFCFYLEKVHIVINIASIKNHFCWHSFGHQNKMQDLLHCTWWSSLVSFTGWLISH